MTMCFFNNGEGLSYLLIDPLICELFTLKMTNIL